MLGWRKQKTITQVPSLQVPPGYRESSQPAFTDGEVIANTYQVRRLLGATDTGQIFEAWDMLLERLVAIKTAWRDAGTPPLRDEARRLAAVGDDCVVGVHCLGLHHDIDYMVMEGVLGTTLADHIAGQWSGKRRMSIDEALRILIALADGLSSIHRAGITHDMLCARNVIFPGQGRVVFSGLGIVCADGVGSCGAGLVAPELSRGEPLVGERIDLYGLGAIAVELLTGKPAYPERAGVDQASAAAELREANASQAIPDVCDLRPEVPTELGDLVFELLAKEPRLRPDSAREVTSQLRVIRSRCQAKPRHDTVRALVVDARVDEVRAMWSRMRRAHASIQVEAACNATDAIAQVRREPPQILVFSMDLPGSMNGFELALYLRGSGDADRCVFVALVDEITPESATVLEQIGVTRVLVRDGGSGSSLGDQLGTLVVELAEDYLHGQSSVSG